MFYNMLLSTDLMVVLEYMVLLLLLKLVPLTYQMMYVEQREFL